MAINQHKKMAMGEKCCMKTGGAVKKVKDTDKDAMKCGGMAKKACGGKAMKKGGTATKGGKC